MYRATACECVGECVGSAGRSGVVHRLDIGTSGVMVFARNRVTFAAPPPPDIVYA